jgi:hypothetical protein
MGRSFNILVQCFLVAVSVTQAAPSEDEITHLPGWNDNLPSKWYSGFVNISSTMGLDMMSHYSQCSLFPFFLFNNHVSFVRSCFSLPTSLLYLFIVVWIHQLYIQTRDFFVFNSILTLF